MNLQGQSPRMIVPKFGEIDLRTIDLPTAERLWKNNFPYIELNEAGIAKYLKTPAEKERQPRFSVAEVIELINAATCPDDCRDHARLYPENKRVAEALKMRLQQFK